MEKVKDSIPDPEALMTTQEVCDMLQVSYHSVLRYIHRKYRPLPFKKFGKGFRFNRREVQKWIDAETAIFNSK